MKGQLLGIFLGMALLGAVTSYPMLEDEDGNLLELIPLRRVPRGLREQYMSEESRPIVAVIPPAGGPPSSVEEDRYEPMTSDSRRELVAAETGHGHSHSPYDYVDYGAYTGGYGAFGWYTDHPVHTYGH